MIEIAEPKQFNITHETTLYIAEDGKPFFRKQDALDHNKDLAVEKIVSKMKFISLDIVEYDYWQYVSTQDELDAVEWYYKAHNVYGDLSLTTWICPRWKDDYYEIYTLDYIKNILDTVI